jgi:hypothetical protein
MEKRRGNLFHRALQHQTLSRITQKTELRRETKPVGVSPPLTNQGQISFAE